MPQFKGLLNDGWWLSTLLVALPDRCSGEGFVKKDVCCCEGTGALRLKPQKRSFMNHISYDETPIYNTYGHSSQWNYREADVSLLGATNT